MKRKRTSHFRQRVSERLNGLSTVELEALYRAGRTAQENDLPRFGLRYLSRGSKARVARTPDGQEMLIVTDPRGRKFITVLLTLPEWVALKSEQGNE